MNAIKLQDHDWAGTRLIGYSTGMLPEDQMLRMEEHLRGCDDCRSRLAPLKALSAADAGHLPASMIATWPRSSKLLSGIERSLVQSHLRACGSCRATLEFAGHEPVLAAEPAPVRAKIVALPARRRAWAWAFGFSAAAAAAAAFILIAQPALLHTDGRGTTATMGSRVHGQAVTFELGLPPATPGAVALSKPSQAAASPIDIDVAGSRSVVLTLPADVSPGPGLVTLTLLRDGHEVARLACPASQLGGTFRIRTDGTWTPGDYELRLLPEGGAPLSRWNLRVR